MGLDGVELVMEVEDEFGITILDSEATGMRTVGDLVQLCLERIQATKSMRCHSLPCFLSLRHLIRDVRNDHDFKLRPRDNVENCLEESDRKILWRRLPELLRTTPRQLRRPKWLRKTLVLIVLGFPILLMAVFPWHVEILILILFATVAFGIVLNWLTIGLRTRTPAGYTTFGDITKRMVGLSVATNPPADAGYDTVFSIVKRIVVEQLGVDDDEVVPTARFVEDLGMD